MSNARRAASPIRYRVQFAQVDIISRRFIDILWTVNTPLRLVYTQAKTTQSNFPVNEQKENVNIVKKILANSYNKVHISLQLFSVYI